MRSRNAARSFGLVPAAGGGTRFAQGARKQYASINGAPMLRHAVGALAAAPEIETVFVVLAPDDEIFRTVEWGALGTRVSPLYCGGTTRRDSVLNGLVAVAAELQAEDWVLVHDAARPCLARSDLLRLIDQAGKTESGGLLALRLADTLKRGGEDNAVLATEPRDGLWLAQTPQMFRYALLLRALRDAPHVTDESSAVEQAGFRPLLVEGSPRNLKVTYAPDLELAALILQTARG
jgi:2-C-methyl-D-erythritol 4-phosphate cytidylyltransferase